MSERYTVEWFESRQRGARLDDARSRIDRKHATCCARANRNALRPVGGARVVEGGSLSKWAVGSVGSAQSSTGNRRPRKRDLLARASRCSTRSRLIAPITMEISRESSRPEGPPLLSRALDVPIEDLDARTLPLQTQP